MNGENKNCFWAKPESGWKEEIFLFFMQRWTWTPCSNISKIDERKPDWNQLVIAANQQVCVSSHLCSASVQTIFLCDFVFRPFFLFQNVLLFGKFCSSFTPWSSWLSCKRLERWFCRMTLWPRCETVSTGRRLCLFVLLPTQRRRCLFCWQLSVAWYSQLRFQVVSFQCAVLLHRHSPQRQICFEKSRKSQTCQNLFFRSLKMVSVKVVRWLSYIPATKVYQQTFPTENLRFVSPIWRH